ncbi:general substrate transporter [Pisolithus microcarpus]|nr:general substrate transporter [Pisolithus microcarpus]
MRYNKRIAANPYIVGTFACIGGGLFGLDISSMSGVLSVTLLILLLPYPNPFLSSNSPDQMRKAAMPAGSLLGALLVTKLGDALGRRRTIIAASIIWDRGMLVVGRIIAGISVGISSAIVPVYQSEITPPSIRGRLVSFQQWSITWGIMLQYFWGLQMIPAIILGIGMLWFPESPRWLVDHGREQEALQILADLHGGGNKKDELQIKQQVDFERSEGAKSYADLFKPGVLRRVILGCSLQMWSQLSGMNVMMYYIIYVFQGAGLTGRRGNLIADSVQYVLNVLFTVPAIWYIDRWGRRWMMILGSFFMGVFLSLVGGLQGGYGEWGSVDNTSVWLIVNQPVVTKAIIVCSYLFVCSFAITMGPVSWTYPAEIFPMRVRSKAVSFSTATNWLFNFALAWAVPPALSSIAWKTYFIFAAFNFAASIHFIFCFPETAQRTLGRNRGGHVFSAWKIKRDVGMKNLHEVLAERGDKHSLQVKESA